MTNDGAPLFWVSGTLASLGQRFSDSRGVTFHHLEIRELGGKVQRLSLVHAVQAIAALVEQNAVGTFFIWALPGERRLWCFARADGPQAVDLDTMQQIIDQAAP